MRTEAAGWAYMSVSYTHLDVYKRQGGARIGAGQKKKALADKIVEGNPGKRKITVREFSDTASLQGEAMPPPREYLAARQKNGKELLAVEVYERTWTWLNERGCAHLIPAQMCIRDR